MSILSVKISVNKCFTTVKRGKHFIATVFTCFTGGGKSFYNRKLRYVLFMETDFI